MKYVIAFVIVFMVFFCAALMNICGRESDWEERREREKMGFPSENDDEGDEFNGETN